MSTQKSEDELMQEARRVMQLDLGRRQSPGDSLYPTSARAIEALRNSVRSMLHHLEQADAATDDERATALLALRDDIVRSGGRADAACLATLEGLAADFRRTVQGEPITEEEINAERERQVAKGYTPEHDREHGIAHVLRYALHYGSRGEHLKAYAMVEAALEIAPPAGVQGEPSHEGHSFCDPRLGCLQDEPSANGKADENVLRAAEERDMRATSHGGDRHRVSKECAECRAVFEPQREPSDAQVVNRGTFGHVWPCPLFYVGNWKHGDEHYEPVRDCTSPAVCGVSTVNEGENR